jgi:ribosomal protein L31
MKINMINKDKSNTKNSKVGTIHPELYPYKIILANGSEFITVTTKKSEKSKENFFRLEMLQSDHPAWTGNFFGRIATNKTSARTKNTNIDIFSA